MSRVEVLEATRTVPNSRGRGRREALNVERIRVAAYCRVSTDDDDQLGSFESQKLYYEQKIRANRDWVNAGIFADEAITGTKVDKREGFQAMIQKCQNGEIDMVLTKSISRFAGNTLDMLQYVRMLRERNIAIYFEKENINTMDMNGELLLTIMSSLAQQEVESLSQNVKMGLKMKMKRGELIGFNGCLGYDYHPEDKTLTINEEEAEIVRFIYDMYLQGYGTTTIANRLMELGKRNKKGEVSWHTHGVMGIIKNERYKGDILLGKTFTTDPISKRRLANMGEEEQYYIRDHHEAIVSREVWDEAERIRLKRNKKNATKHGIKNCPNCKAIDEVILEGAFIEAFGLLAGNFEDVLEIVMAAVESSLANDEDVRRRQQLDKDISSLESKKSRMTDMLIDGTISKEAYDDKMIEFNRKLHTLAGKKQLLNESINKQKDVEKRMAELRQILENEEILDEFDRVVFENIIDRVMVGGYNEDGSPDPYKLTFVLKGNQTGVVPNAKEQFKAKNSEKGKMVS